MKRRRNLVTLLCTTLVLLALVGCSESQATTTVTSSTGEGTVVAQNTEPTEGPVEGATPEPTVAPTEAPTLEPTEAPVEVGPTTVENTADGRYLVNGFDLTEFVVNGKYLSESLKTWDYPNIAVIFAPVDFEIWIELPR